MSLTRPRSALDNMAWALDRGFQAFRAAPLPFLAIGLAVNAASEFMTAGIGEDSPGVFLALLWAASCWGIGISVMIHLVHELQNGRPPNIRVAFRQTLRRALPLAAAAVVTTYATLVGLVLLILPGLLALVRLFAVQAVMIIEKAGLVDAFRRSSALSRGYGWSILLTMIWVALGSVAVGVLATPLKADSPVLASLIRITFGIPLTVFSGILPATLYFRIRIDKEAYDVAMLADRLDPARSTGSATAG